MQKLILYLNDVVAELKKVVWPTRDMLTQSTIIVIVISLLFSIYILGVDKVLNFIVGFILRE
ncbi:MAG: preprotein translocase subunit SecE [Candidatus Raymondbacteria bacterium RifOxyA12_full_50_37]|uniref:Protein translocase subunit SecE n=1 Tax=Candidatus Raymondbacteria bacterium RIFOXYD12_FULL_49_13 TaxID=1817890 RepID=A0A1F7FDQ9_UNCRA|nr:MAG: preprotein translocase subunit SecE [Candidatus Raymondbacteria bacterium RifOxyA12_full_50_37]OGJ94044.1 MAG: preprotein translocase subunit SecE [Candidatus Raymondbacteria bacterium RIFOXYA2_FULL_49_16]OGJ96869.1 MAG: preprotein translocase subunit SecE [Candidatus Raymondbacteria bacterium RIFOXYC2_FULL_50_21]OGJ97488.1 MAG: preprotein translocase subunit SecE [Candidatus Raymondbacteria bacterium RifOxyC12_full_50_8]OGK00940.1 MAG: preprotein translocase subunit SecE [Candidatus Ra